MEDLWIEFNSPVPPPADEPVLEPQQPDLLPHADPQPPDPSQVEPLVESKAEEEEGRTTSVDRQPPHIEPQPLDQAAVEPQAAQPAAVAIFAETETKAIENTHTVVEIVSVPMEVAEPVAEAVVPEESMTTAMRASTTAGESGTKANDSLANEASELQAAVALEVAEPQAEAAPALEGKQAAAAEAPPPPATADFCADTAKFFRLLHASGSVIEIRSFNCPIFPGAGKRRTASGYFDNLRSVLSCVNVLDLRKPPGVYCTLNPVQPELLARACNRINNEAEATTTDEQIVRRRLIVLDIDPIRPAGVSATDAEMGEAVALAARIHQWLASQGWPEPVWVLSGNGAYLLYRVELPNDKPATDLVQRVLHGLANRFDNQAAIVDRVPFNAARIIKIPGTTARKGDDFKGSAGNPARPHRVAKFRLPPGPLLPVPKELLEAVAAKPEEMAPQRAAAATNGRPARPLTKRQAESALDRCRKYVAKMPPAISGQDGSGRTLHVACECFRFGLSDADAMTVLAEFNQECIPPWSEAELQHKITDARAKVEAAGEFGMRNERQSALSRRSSAVGVGAGHSSPLNRPGSESEESGTVDLCFPEARTDSANARRFVAMHGEIVRWCDPWKKWLIWDGRRWAIDTKRQIEALAKEAIAAMWQEVAPQFATMEGGPSKEIVNFARISSNARGINDMLALARSEPGIAILPEQLDADPWLLNLQNGTIDLRSGIRREFRKEDYITKIAPVVHDPTAQCPTWERFVAEIMAGDEGLVGFLQRLAGYWLTGSVRDHILAIFYGKGANGKSVYLSTAQSLLGQDYSMHAPPDLLMAKRNESHPTERADLAGRRLVCCVETEEGRRLAESLVKELTGGDPIRARRMREDHWEFLPTHKLVISANHRPVVRGTDHGIWRRLRLVPFTVTIPDDRQDKDLPEKLRLELSGILNWCLAGCRAWQGIGLDAPDAVLAATQDYREASDILADFFADCCITDDPNASVRAGKLYTTYTEWCKRNGHEPDNSTVFGRKLTDGGYDADKKGTVIRRGIALLVVTRSESASF